MLVPGVAIRSGVVAELTEPVAKLGRQRPLDGDQLGLLGFLEVQPP